jgi:hypothetical protein
LIPDFNKGGEVQEDGKIEEYKTNSVLQNEFKGNPLIQKYPELKNIIPILKQNKGVQEKEIIFSKEDLVKKLYYVRYVDDILLGVVGTKDDCRKLLDQINKFLQKTLKLELNLNRTVINLA